MASNSMRSLLITMALVGILVAIASANADTKKVFKRGITEWRFKRLQNAKHQLPHISLDDIYDMTIELKVKEELANQFGGAEQPRPLKFKLTPVSKECFLFC